MLSLGERFMKFRTIGILIVILPLLVFSSCNKRKQETTDGKVVIVFWHSFVSSTVPALNDLIKLFEEEHPSIKINAQYVPTGDALVQKLVTAVQSNTAPDISWIHSDFLDKLVEGHAIYPMDNFIKGKNGLSEEEIDDIFPASLLAGTWHDTLYAMPMEATSLALLYNRGLFKKAGLDPNHPPKDWKELEDFAKKLTVDTDGDGKTDQYGFFVPVFPASGDLNIWMVLQWSPFLWQAGGEEITDAQDQVLFNSEAGVKALTLWKNLYDALDFGKFGLTHDMAFASEKAAMVLDGPWDLPRYRQMKNIDWAVAPLPAGPVKRATYIAGEQLTIFKQSKHPDEAWEFVKWVIQPRVQAMFSMKSGYLPIRKSVLQLQEYQNYLVTDPALKAFVDQMSVGQARKPIDRHRVEINRAIAEAIEQAAVGKVDPQAALDKAAEKANKLLRSTE